MNSFLLLAVVISWENLPEAAVRQKCFDLTGRYAVACMELREGNCTIYSPNIRHDRDDENFKRLGEEVAHCFLGDFHKKK